MLSLLSRALGAALVLCAIPVPVEAADPLPLSEYGKLPEVQFTAISPSGRRIALITEAKGKRVILAIEDQTKALAMIEVGDKKVRSLSWVGEDRLLLLTSQTEDLGVGFTTDKAEFVVAQVLPISDREKSGIVFGDSSRYPDAVFGRYGVREIDGAHYGFFGGIELVGDRPGSRAGYRLDHTRPHLFKVNLESLKTQKVANSAMEGHGKDWLIDAAGEVAFTLDVNFTSGDWNIRNAGGTKLAEGTQTGAAISLIGLGAAGTSAIYVYRGEEGDEWYEVAASGGAPQPFLPDTTFENLFFDPATGHLMGYLVEEDDTEEYVFLDKTLNRKAERVRAAFAEFETSLVGFTRDLGHVIVRTSGNGDSGSRFAVNLAEGRAQAIAYERTAITPEHVGAISTFKYTAGDGLELDGILTLPPGREPKNLPLVMMPHGGPHSADTPAFDWWAQAFASRGYAVFQPNFRGSTNRDEAFKRAGYGEWGRKMQSDKTDGLKALAEAGIIDPARACITGASYGGYAALAGVTVEQGLYRCAVAVAPVSDIRDVYVEDYRASGRDRTTRVALREQLGDPGLWDAVSPLKLAGRADAPIMLIHGVDDTVVPFSHSAKMADKLKDAGKPHELVTLMGEDHNLSFAETRMQMLENAVRFVQKHNPAD